MSLKEKIISQKIQPLKFKNNLDDKVDHVVETRF